MASSFTHSNLNSAIQWKPEIGDHFDISEDPVKIAELPAGAMLFLRHDVAAARQTIERTYSAAQVDESMRLHRFRGTLLDSRLPSLAGA